LSSGCVGVFVIINPLLKQDYDFATTIPSRTKGDRQTLSLGKIKKKKIFKIKSSEIHHFKGNIVNIVT